MIVESMLPPRPHTSGKLLRNIVLFGRLLRAAGMKVTPDQIIDWVKAIAYVNLRDRQEFKDSARAILVSQRDHLGLFDHAFDLFWQVWAEEGQLATLPSEERQESSPDSDDEQHPAEPDASEDESAWDPAQAGSQTVFTFSASEILRHKDFAELSTVELNAVRQLILSMRWDLEPRRTRRKIRAARGAYLDMRRALRQNLRFGGEPLQLAWRRQKQKRRPIVVLCDISGSMERYSRILLQFIYAISNGLDRVEAFVFSTRLTRITRHLRDKNIDRAIDQAVSTVHDWAGGTRIGEAVKTFNYRWARRVLGQGAIVIVISDGWDRGDAGLLGHQMAQLQLSCHRLIWLNPLLGSPTYRPLTRGMQAALPHVDDFLPVHNLASIEQLGHLLEHIGEHRPRR